MGSPNNGAHTVPSPLPFPRSNRRISGTISQGASYVTLDRPTSRSAVSGIGRHALAAWGAVNGVLAWARAPARHRIATQSFGERAVKGCLWWFLFRWFFLTWRSLPYFAAGIGFLFVATYAVLVSMVWLVALGVAGVASVFHHEEDR